MDKSAVMETISVLIIATPFMFVSMGLFALIMWGLSYLKDPFEKSK